MGRGKKKEDTSKSDPEKPDSSLDESAGATASTPPPTDVATLLQWIIQRDDKREDARRKEDDARRKEEDARRNEESARFQELILRLTPQQPAASPASSPVSSSAAPTDSPTPPTPRATIQPPKALTADASPQQFREWKREWSDYAVLVDLVSLPLSKQHIQLRMCLTAEMRRVLEHKLDVPADTTCSVEDVLAKLETHIKNASNEALRRKAFSECKQADGESFDDFWIRLKILSQEIDLCKAQDQACCEQWKKHGILMGIRDEELTQKLIEMDRSATLQDVLEKCRSHESSKTASSALKDTVSSRAVSQYKREKKAALKQKSKMRATTSTCRACGKKGHWATASKCPARNARCRVCNRQGHYDKCCPKTRKAKKTKEEDTSQDLKVVSSVSPSVSYARSVTSTARPKPQPSPKVRVSIRHNDLSGSLAIIPDTGADTTVIGLQHLSSLGLSKKDLAPPAETIYYNADGSQMPPAAGSFRGIITYGNRSTTCWIDVQPSLTTPLLSWTECKNLGIVPDYFPRQMSDMRIANRVHGLGSAPMSNPPKLLPLPLNQLTSPDEARKYFLHQYADVLVKKDDLHYGPLKMMVGPPMRIHLRENATPFAIHTPRMIPLAFQEPTRKELESLVTQGILKPVEDEPSEWCHPMVVVPKANGGVRITTDLSKLNKQVSRPAHPSPTPFTAIRSISPQSKFFTTVDALCGYWQLPLHEDDQHLTTFITPYGRFRYCCGPMGFAATGDAFCLRGDKALQGVTNCIKVVDDILLHDEDYLSHLQRVNEVLSRCRHHGITLNAEKFIVAASETSFCGYKLSNNGIEADPEKVKAIAEFPTPANLTDLRSFMGLVNQLAEFTPKISTAAAPLRPLMSPKRAFTWTADHTKAFIDTKQALSRPPILATFDPALPTILQTDASRLYGLGYVLLQDHGAGRYKMVQCGSRFLTDTETRYATIELEMQAVVWAISKCKFYLRGLQHFSVMTDHRPLVPILNHYSLDAIENPRLQRMKDKVAPYIYTAMWRAGKELCIPDALSRSPVSRPTMEDGVFDAEMNTSVKIVALQAVQSTKASEAIDEQEDLFLEELRTAASKDASYEELLHHVKSGFPKDRYNLPSALRPYWKIRNELYNDGDLVLYGPRVVVPASLRRSTLARLHDSHCGVEATKRRAQQTVFWPGINADIVNTVRACEPCQRLQPSQQQEPLMLDDKPTRPFMSVSTDFFSVAGKHFLVYADRLSGWPVVIPCGTSATSASTIRFFRHLFCDLGVPVRLRTDGGPQFSSREFATFLQRWGVRHAMSSPHYPQSNGHAEAAVKKVKHLIMKTAPNGNIDSEQFDRGLLELRNTPNFTGRSPAQILAFMKEWQTKAEDCDRRAAVRAKDVKTRYDKRAHSLPKLEIGAQVRVQVPTSKRWDKVGTVMGIGKSRDYHIRLPSGRILWRNRRFLRPTQLVIGNSADLEEQQSDDAPGSSAPFVPVEPRRSERIKLKSVQDSR
ncbi:uncharacterized protein LOC134768457 [Penaeus indicus]|uniref:uncharacterized protein LOC134768457 n=1 Tax=Penaeus indicus TaxID=29960 RepID=UPI00300D38C4